ncbi:MAG: hypothetical protein GF308_06205 [Candidatus Heimdallarchaeota archaeon]|nr:hypothetical protein [Candidatus Heimdallarchaeota archaeon]
MMTHSAGKTSQKTTNIIYRKVCEDSNYSVFHHYKRHYRIMTVFTSILMTLFSAPTIIIGIIFLVDGEPFGIGLIVMGLIFMIIFGIFISYSSIRTLRTINAIEVLKNNKQTKNLLELASSTKEAFIESSEAFIASMVLVDSKITELVPLLKERLDNTTNPREVEKLSWILNIFALKLGFTNMLELFENKKELLTPQTSQLNNTNELS